MKLFIVIILIGSPWYAPAITLKKAFATALNKRASISNAEADRSLALKRKDQVVARLYPNLALRGSYGRRDRADSEASFLSDPSQYQARIALSQPLYRGGAEYTALSLAEEGVRFSQFAIEQTKLELYREIMQPYFRLLALQNRKAILIEEASVLRKQITLLQERVSIGRSKESEVLSSQSMHARIQAELTQVAREEVSLQHSLEALVGEPIQMAEALSLPEEDPEDLSSQLERSAELDLLRSEEKRLGLELASNRAAFRPTLDLNANYYLARNGTLKGSQWDAQLALSWDIYSGGKDRAEDFIRRVKREKARRTLKETLHQKNAVLSGLQKELGERKKTQKAFAKATELARKAYASQRAEYQLGLISHLEVLRSLDNYLVTKSLKINEEVETQKTWIEMHLAAGVIP